MNTSLTFKEYYNYFIGVNQNQEINTNTNTNIKGKCIENDCDWGWFIDLELNVNTNTNINNTNMIKRFKSSKYISVPETIKEVPSIRSIKSINNLHDNFMIFEMDNDDEYKNKTTITSYLCGALIVAMCCLGLK